VRTARYVASAFIVFLFILFAFLGGFLLHDRLVGRSLKQPANTEEQFAVFWEAWTLAQDKFVDPKALDAQKMTYGAISGMLDSLGDIGHTRFLTPEELKAEQTGMRGEYSGIGAEVGIRDGQPVIVAPFDGSPAQEAGVQPGDIIVRVDGEDTSGLSLSQVISRIRGAEGEPVTLTLLREGRASLIEVTIVRKTIKIPAVSWTMIPGTSIAHIRISQFSQNAFPDLRSALTEAEEQNAAGLIVDVRSNPGGLLDQAVSVSSQFLESGNVVLEESRNGTRKPYPVQKNGIATSTPMVVLVNEGSASASEIFAGAMQDNNRSKVIGQRTFGTGTILSTFHLRDGSAVLLGTGQWLTPNGRSLRIDGVTPDIAVEMPPDGHILTPKQTATMSVKEIEEAGDTQLLRGIQLLQESATALSFNLHTTVPDRVCASAN